jgi:flagellar brake protein
MALSTAQPCSPAPDKAPPAQAIRGTEEIALWLAQVRDGDLPVVLRGAGDAQVTGTLWAVDREASRLCFGVDEKAPALQALLQGSAINASTEVDRIGLEFELQRPLLVRSASGCALQTALPTSMARHQRRNSYRVRSGQRVGPSVRLQLPGHTHEALNLRVLDISIGGCSLLLPSTLPVPQLGFSFKAVRVEMGPGASFTADMALHVVRTASGSQEFHLGCEWQRMDGAAQRSLQRYIDDTQRRRRSLAAL